MENSAVSQVANLEVGECYTKTRVFPSTTPDMAEAVRKAKLDLTRSVSSIVSRAMEREPRKSYRTHAIHCLTRNFDVVVSAIVVRE